MVRTRIVCVSDTHGYSPKEAFKLPRGDVLIHAGDLTNNGSISELRKTINWIEEADFEVKIVVAGNHDITLDREFYSKYSRDLPDDAPREPLEDCIKAMSSASFIYLNHEATTIRLTRADGPRAIIKVFGSPRSPVALQAGDSGKYEAFAYNEYDTKEGPWTEIPAGVDIVVAHTPPRGHCDQVGDDISIGCEALRQALARVRPKLVVCGHVHEARGAERLKWGISDDQYFEGSSIMMPLPPRGSKKQSLVDLTGRRQSPLPALDNNDGLSAGAWRRETCIVNPCIRANGYPFTGGKIFNAPIVIDLDLPEDNSQ